MSDQNKGNFYIFDLDGTLLDTSKLIIKCLLNTFKEYSDLQIKLKDLDSKFKTSPRNIILQYTGHENIYKKMKTYWSYYRQLYTKYVKVYKYINDLLNNLLQEGYGIGIVTSLVSNLAYKLIENYLKVDFDVIVAYHDTTKHKPHPEPIFLAIRKYKKIFEIETIKAIYIGDTEDDILAGKNANIYTILAAWGLNNKEILEIKSYNPDFIITEPLTILNIKL